MQSTIQNRLCDWVAAEVIDQQQTALAGLLIFRVGNLIESDFKIVVSEKFLEAGRALQRVKIEQRKETPAGADELAQLGQLVAAVRRARAGDDQHAAVSRDAVGAGERDFLKEQAFLLQYVGEL